MALPTGTVLGLGTQPLGDTPLGAGRDITVRIVAVRFRSTQVTAVRARTVTATARLIP